MAHIRRWFLQWQHRRPGFFDRRWRHRPCGARRTAQGRRCCRPRGGAGPPARVVACIHRCLDGRSFATLTQPAGGRRCGMELEWAMLAACGHVLCVALLSTHRTIAMSGESRCSLTTMPEPAITVFARPTLVIDRAAAELALQWLVDPAPGAPADRAAWEVDRAGLERAGTGLKDTPTPDAARRSPAPCVRRSSRGRCEDRGCNAGPARPAD